MAKNDVLVRAWDNYTDQVDTFAQMMFTVTVKPWLKRHGYDFVSGNGTWIVSKDNPNNKDYGYDYIDEPDIPKHVLDVLQMEVPGMPGNDLGSLMPDFDYAVDVQNNGE